MVPKGVGTGRPPENAFAPRVGWQSLQLPMAASSRPRLTSAGSNDDGAGTSMAAIAGRQVMAKAATAAAIATKAIALAMILFGISQFCFLQAAPGRRITLRNITLPRFTKAYWTHYADK